MTAWPEAFCRQLASRGFFVVRFDNRDVGLSTKFEAAGAPDLMAVMASMQQGGKIESAYTLWDMAADASGLLDVLGIRSAHIVGASMGGMIAQAFAIKYPERTRSLTPIMSTTSEPDLPQASPEAMGVLMAPRPANRASGDEAAVASRKVLAGGGFPMERTEGAACGRRDLRPLELPRGNGAPAKSRSLPPVAGVTCCGRSRCRRSLSTATRTRSCVAPAASTPQAIEGAEMVTVPEMGHELPEGAWPLVFDAISGWQSGRWRRSERAWRMALERQGPRTETVTADGASPIPKNADERRLSIGRCKVGNLPLVVDCTLYEWSNDAAVGPLHRLAMRTNSMGCGGLDSLVVTRASIEPGVSEGEVKQR